MTIPHKKINQNLGVTAVPTPTPKPTSVSDRLSALGYPEPALLTWAAAARLALSCRLYDTMEESKRCSPTEVERCLAELRVPVDVRPTVVVVAISLAARAGWSECDLLTRGIGHDVSERILLRARLVEECKLVGCSSADAVSIVAVVAYLYNIGTLNEANPYATSASDVRIVRASAHHLAKRGVEYAMV